MRAHIFPHHLKKIYYLSTSYHLQELNVLRRESNKAKFKGENEDLADLMNVVHCDFCASYRCGRSRKEYGKRSCREGSTCQAMAGMCP